MNRLYDNMVLEYDWETPARRLDRVLWIEESGTNAVVIDVHDPKAQVRLEKCARLVEALEDGTARPAADPFVHLKAPDSSFSSQQLADRNRIVAAMSVLIHALPVERFGARSRSARIAEITSRKANSNATADAPEYISKPHVYLLWRRYCQRGQMDNALISDRHRSGWTRAQRDEAAAQGTARKIGPGGRGVNLSPQMRDWLVQGARLFWERTAEGKRKRTWVEAHQLTLEKFFSRGYRKDGHVRIPILPPAEELPTVRQMRLAYVEQMVAAEAQRQREGNRRFNLDHRAVLGSQTQMAHGPMELAQADSTVADLYLVHVITREPLGRPSICLIRDTLTRLIVGFCVTWEHASWIVAGLAIQNMAMDKVEYCASLNIDIEPEWWPCHHLPQVILADCGELLVKNSSQLVSGLGLRIFNTASGRADFKGIIESGFDDVNEFLIHRLPGAVLPHMGDRGYTGPKPVDMARLDIHEFRALMALYILDYNRHRYLERYPLADDMLGQVNPVPCELWAWGVANRQGHLRQEPMDVVRLNTLSSGVATVTYRGVHFKGMYYRPPHEDWAVRARMQGSWRIPVLYDSRSLVVIYLKQDRRNLSPGQPVVVPLERIDSGHKRVDLDIGEIQHSNAVRAEAKRRAASDAPQQEADYNARVGALVKTGKEKTERARGGRRKSSPGDLKARREDAIAQERRTEVTHIGITSVDKVDDQQQVGTDVSTSEFTDADFSAARRAIRRIEEER